MNKEKYVFSQLILFLNEDKFRRIVDKYRGNRYIKHFTCWNQLLALMFGQLSNRESLRDLLVALEAHHSKCYHLGMGKNVSKSSLARANQDRDYHIFEEYAYYLVSEAQQKRVNHIFKLGGNVYAFDSTAVITTSRCCIRFIRLKPTSLSEQKRLMAGVHLNSDCTFQAWIASLTCCIFWLKNEKKSDLRYS